MSFQVNNKKIVKNTMALYIRMGFTMIISFFTTRIVLQVLGVDDYGLNNLVGSVVSLLSFINGSMGTAVQRFYSIEIGKNNKERLSKVFGTGLYLHVIVACITVFIAEIFAFFFLDKLNIPHERLFAAQCVFQISILTLALNIINVPFAALLRAREEFSKTAVIDIIQAILRLLILYLLCHISYDKLITFSLLNFTISLYYLGSITWLARKYKECRTTMCKDRQLIKEMIKFVSLLLVTVLASLFRDNGIVIFINLFFGLAINAAYAVAIQVMHLVSTFVANFKQSVVPQLMAAYGANDLDKMNKLVNIGTKTTFILMLIISLPLIFESQSILNLWLKTPPQHASELVVLALINVNISSFTYFMYQGVHATGHITKQQTCMSILYLMNILFIYIFFKLEFNFYSAFYITIITSLIQCVVNVCFANKHFNYNIREFIQILMRCIITCAIIILILSLVHSCYSVSISRIFITTISTIVSSIIIGYYLILNQKEKDFCVKYVKRIINKKAFKVN